MRIKFEEEEHQIMVPVGDVEFTLEREGHEKAIIRAFIHEDGILDVISAKNVMIGQKPVNILKKDGACERMNKVTVHLIEKE